MNQHLGDDDLDRYAMGKISELEAAGFEEHVLICEACQEKLSARDEYATAMRAAAVELRKETVPARNRWSFPRLVPVFAALILLVAVAVSVPRFGGGSLPPVAIGLTAMRGAATEAAVPAGRALSLTPDLTGLRSDPSYRLEIVDERGAVTWQGFFSPSQSGIGVPRQRAGIHFVRVYSTSGELLREYGLNVTSAR